MKNNTNFETGFFDEIIVDNFAGGGGASTGIELATGRPVAVAINHDPAAILMHKTNHPHTLHLQESVWDIDPIKVCGGHSVGLAWFSPDCKHFSKAKGGKPVEKKIRGLAWIVCKWAGLVRPRVIILENVEEFVTWGPIRKGKPVKSKKGQTFRKWVSQLEDLGYKIEHRELVAADYGAPTTRKRFVLIARCDGKPIVWPERTHAPADSEEVKSGKCKPWRSAAEIIDWSLPCPSIFESKEQIKEKYNLKVLRPLKDNTLRRITRGIDKFVLKSANPFIVPIGYGENKGQKPRIHDINQPLPTIVSSGKHYYVDAMLSPLHIHNNTGAGGNDMRSPVNALTTGSQQMLISPKLSPLHMHNHSNAAGTDMRDPVNTITASGYQLFIAPHLSKYFGGVVGEDTRAPLPTVTAIDHNALVSANLIQYHTEQSENVRGQGLCKPINTVDCRNRYGLSVAHLTQYFSGDHYHSPSAPLHTVTTMIREGVTLAHLTEYYGNAQDALRLNKPFHTLTAKDRQALTLAHITEFKGNDKGQAVNAPLRTVTTSSGEFGAVYTTLVKVSDGVDLKYWPQVRELLNTYCDYNIADNEILLLWVGGVPYFISDIGLRMLSPKELYKAQGFPDDYKIEKDYRGFVYPKTEQVARAGNAVCPPMATAVVKANFPEWCQYEITSMTRFHEIVAV